MPTPDYLPGEKSYNVVRAELVGSLVKNDEQGVLDAVGKYYELEAKRAPKVSADGSPVPLPDADKIIADIAAEIRNDPRIQNNADTLASKMVNIVETALEQDKQDSKKQQQATSQPMPQDSVDLTQIAAALKQQARLQQDNS